MWHLMSQSHFIKCEVPLFLPGNNITTLMYRGAVPKKRYRWDLCSVIIAKLTLIAGQMEVLPLPQIFVLILSCRIIYQKKTLCFSWHAYTCESSRLHTFRTCSFLLQNTFRTSLLIFIKSRLFQNESGWCHCFWLRICSFCH
jgi:hypothetical protein